MIGIDSEALCDLAAFADLEDAKRLAAALPDGVAVSATGLRPDLEESIREHLRVDRVAPLFQRAGSAPEGPAGEPARYGLRAAGREFLAWAAREVDLEIRERGKRDSPEGGFDVGLARVAPPDREALLQRWERVERELEADRAEWARLRGAAAARCGAGSVGEFLAAAEPADVRESALRFEREAIRPLDGAIRDAVRREGSSALLRIEGLGEATFPRSRIAGVAERLAGRFQSGVRCRIEGRVEALGAWCEMRIDPAGSPALLLGALAGPRALVRCLGALGRALRAEFQRAQVGIGSRWLDPAFAFATETLFRRLVLTGRGLLPEPDTTAWAGALRLDLSLAPRVAWAYLFLAVEQANRREHVFDPATADGVLERALGRSPLPGERILAFAADPGCAAELRGTVFGLLIEEWLLTRYGRNWTEQRAAVRALQECWEAERAETAESVAAGLGLGTMETVTILDRCRP